MDVIREFVAANYFVLGISAVSVVCLSIFVYTKVFPASLENGFLRDEDVFNEIHEATFEDNVIKAITLIGKYSHIINLRHPVDGYTPFLRACLNGSTQLVMFMLNNGADLSVRSFRGETPFYLAVFHHIQNRKNKNASCIRVLYYAGSDINAVNHKGYTALHLAATFGHTSLVKWLLDKRADANVQPYPYVLAYGQGYYETAELLRNSSLQAIE